MMRTAVQSAHSVATCTFVQIPHHSEATLTNGHCGSGSSGRTKSGGFKTKDGTLYVSRPFTTHSPRRKRKAIITFVPRKSTFDTTNEFSTANEFRGFFTLFWISTFIFTVRTYVRSIETHGAPLNLQFASMFSQDAITLALSDAVLVLSTGICVPFAKVIAKGWINYYWTGLAIQHVWQTIVLAVAVKWTFESGHNRQWPWVQSGFLTLHTLVMIMKMHSYMTVNGYFSYLHSQSKLILDELKEVTSRVGGWDHALAQAKARRDAEAAKEDEPSTGTSTPDLSHTPGTPDGVQREIVDASAASVLRKRLVAAQLKSGNAEVVTTQPAQTIAEALSTGKPGPHPLVDHPDEEIASLAREYSEIEAELVSSGPEYVRWPENITFKNFAVYQLIPTLVYELEYPRTDKIRPLYVFEKTVATFGTFALLYTITETFILPMTPKASGQSLARSLLDLALPFMFAYLLLFYIIFECICNGFAELSYFADRQFYEDWWNSTSWDEFSRKWNKPVHMFLLRHVYAESSYRVSRSSAMFLTFLLSAAVHEMVMAIVTQKIRMYLFTLQLIQIPLIYLGRLPVIKRNKLLGNIVFWLGLYAGFPLLCVGYVTY
ncbi:MBOAT-domain-containing protein [Neolentinus lepideus HHB14362 ss-1]|uniref:O-acyltransferase n=1 Tax=Neolentinus lepideus HHB14362 ss-1 TaxID=1314782 RepID=A0A165PVV4_9AGAM|nr:MBOAT-domain-containing protein [Neolentinus lepideus HHB14362 ss-1]